MAVLCMAGCANVPGNTPSENDTVQSESINVQSEESVKEKIDMELYFDDNYIPVDWENNATVSELLAEVERGDIIVPMRMYGGNEQFGPLGKRYTNNDARMRTENGDIVLYSSDQIVVFYGSNTWEYTKLGKMQLSDEEVTELLSNGDITLKITSGK